MYRIIAWSRQSNKKMKFVPILVNSTAKGFNTTIAAAQTKMIAGITFKDKPIDSEYVYSSRDSQGRTMDRNIIITAE